MKREQIKFFEELQKIQERVVVSTEFLESKNNEKIAYEITYETIYRILELVDGYTTDEISLDIIDNKTKKSLKDNIQLHDVCSNYLEDGSK